MTNSDAVSDTLQTLYDYITNIIEKLESNQKNQEVSNQLHYQVTVLVNLLKLLNEEHESVLMVAILNKTKYILENISQYMDADANLKKITKLIRAETIEREIEEFGSSVSLLSNEISIYIYLAINQPGEENGSLFDKFAIEISEFLKMNKYKNIYTSPNIQQVFRMFMLNAVQLKSVRDKMGEILTISKKLLKASDVVALKADFIEKATNFDIKYLQGVIIDNIMLENGRIGDENLFKTRWNGTAVAIKKLPFVPFSEFSANTISSKEIKLYKAVLSEIKIFQKFESVSCPNVVHFYGITTINRCLGIVTEFISKTSLEYWLYNEPRKLTLEVSSSIIYGVANGLNFLHENKIIHNNVRSNNVLLSGSFHPVLVGFEMSKLSTTEPIQEVISFEPSTQWRPPEFWELTRKLLKLVKACPFSSDVYSFAILVDEVFTKQKPWDGFDSEAIKEGVTAGNRPYEATDDKIPRKMFELMTKCWVTEIPDRITMQQVLNFLEFGGIKRPALPVNIRSKIDGFEKMKKENEKPTSDLAVSEVANASTEPKKEQILVSSARQNKSETLDAISKSTLKISDTHIDATEDINESNVEPVKEFSTINALTVFRAASKDRLPLKPVLPDFLESDEVSTEPTAEDVNGLNKSLEFVSGDTNIAGSVIQFNSMESHLLTAIPKGRNDNELEDIDQSSAESIGRTVSNINQKEDPPKRQEVHKKSLPGNDEIRHIEASLANSLGETIGNMNGASIQEELEGFSKKVLYRRISKSARNLSDFPTLRVDVNANASVKKTTSAKNVTFRNKDSWNDLLPIKHSYGSLDRLANSLAISTDAKTPKEERKFSRDEIKKEQQELTSQIVQNTVVLKSNLPTNSYDSPSHPWNLLYDLQAQIITTNISKFKTKTEPQAVTRKADLNVDNPHHSLWYLLNICKFPSSTFSIRLLTIKDIDPEIKRYILRDTLAQLSYKRFIINLDPYLHLRNNWSWICYAVPPQAVRGQDVDHIVNDPIPFIIAAEVLNMGEVKELYRLLDFHGCSFGLISYLTLNLPVFDMKHPYYILIKDFIESYVFLWMNKVWFPIVKTKSDKWLDSFCTRVLQIPIPYIIQRLFRIIKLRHGIGFLTDLVVRYCIAPAYDHLNLEPLKLSLKSRNKLEKTVMKVLKSKKSNYAKNLADDSFKFKMPTPVVFDLVKEQNFIKYCRLIETSLVLETVVLEHSYR